MADNWANWYTGNMSPPDKLPNGSYQAAPIVSSPMSIDEMYRGIYGQPSSELTTRQVQTVKIDPYTGRPVQPTVNASAGMGIGAQSSGSGSVSTRQKVLYPNAVPGPTPVAKYQDRLPTQPVGMNLAGLVSNASAGVGSMSGGQGSLAMKQPSRGLPDVGYRATMRFATPNASLTGAGSAPMVPGPAYTPQPVSGDPWGGMRMNGQAAAPMPGYGAAPGAAQAQQQARGLFDSLFGGGSSAAPSLYSPSPGSYMPTMAPGGKQRRKDADRSSASPAGSGGSLVGR